MHGRIVAALLLGLLAGLPARIANAAPSSACGGLSRDIPARSPGAPAGSAVVDQVKTISGPERDGVVAAEVLSGNIPAFLRHLQPVEFSGKAADGQPLHVVICVTPDYLAVGADQDFVRVPLGLPAAAEVADRLGFLLPTTRMVDAIYAQAHVHLAPQPMPAGDQMRSTDYFWRHNQTVNAQRAAYGAADDELVAGQKKDLVLSKRLLAIPGRVAIYGWHRSEHDPIQPLSTVHGERYADYSHGIRLVSMTAFVNGAARSLQDLLQDPAIAWLLSSEGPIAGPRAILASLSRHVDGEGRRLAATR